MALEGKVNVYLPLLLRERGVRMRTSASITYIEVGGAGEVQGGVTVGVSAPNLNKEKSAKIQLSSSVSV